MLERRHEKMREGHGSLNDDSDTLSEFLNFAALTKVWVPQWGACREWRFGDLRSVHNVNVLKIHLTVEAAV